MGDQVLAVTERVLAGGAPAAAGTRLYADILGRALVVLPLGFGLALLGVLLVFFALASSRRRALGRPLAAIAAGLVGALLLAWLGQFALGVAREGVYWRAWPGVTLTAIYAATIAAILVSLRTIGRRADRRELRVAFWLVFTLVGAAIAAVAPGGAIYFLLPPLIAALGLAFGRRRPAIEAGAALLAAAALFLTFGPALGLFEELLSAGPFWVFTPLGGLILLPWLIELEPLIARPRRIAPIAAGLCLAGWIAAAVTPAYSNDRQQRFGFAYLWDAQANRGHWMIEGDGARRPAGFAWRRMPLPWAPKARRWMADAPAWPGPAPAAVRIGESRADGGRRIRLRIATHGADQVTLFAPPGTALAAAGAPGFVQPFGEGGADDPFVLRCTGRACDGAELDLVARGAAPLSLTLAGTFYSPQFPRTATPPSRPPLARPQYAPDSRIALTRLRL
jgi:hypothetical protein